MSEFKEFEGKFYRVCSVKYNGINIDGALIPEDNYKKLKTDKKIKSMQSKNAGFNSAKKQLWPVFSEYIRLRDDYVCCSCGAIGEKSSQYKGGHSRVIQAGHYFPKSAYSGIYYNEKNVHAQCAVCNMNMEDPTVKNSYTNFMINKYGIETIELLKVEGKSKKLSTGEMSILLNYYKQKIKNIS